jgi:hypothetical protein
MFNFGPIFDGVENYPKTTFATMGVLAIVVVVLMTKHFGLW